MITLGAFKVGQVALPGEREGSSSTLQSTAGAFWFAAAPRSNTHPISRSAAGRNVWQKVQTPPESVPSCHVYLHLPFCDFHGADHADFTTIDCGAIDVYVA
jgi:hypothetical protein